MVRNAIFSLTVGVAVASNEASCPGFDRCPTAEDFPLPYNQSYPSKYPFQPGLQFPDDFVWGVGTASYQIEGAYNEGGRGASIWDTFSGANTVGMPGSVCKKTPCPVSDVMKTPGATGNVANDHYHKYKQDVAMMKDMGLKTYRFSVAWPRIVPTGRFAEGVNAEGVQFYHNLIDELVSNGIEPVVTMYHWDLPQGLLDANYDEIIPACNSSYRQGWYECSGDPSKPVPLGLKSNIVDEFTKYGSFLLKEYGQKVKTWVTFNEAWTFTWLASGYGKAPSVQPYMDIDVWPYVAGQNIILGHAKVVEQFRAMQKSGELSGNHTIGITNNMDWREPATLKRHDIAAAEVEVEKQLGWYSDPIYGLYGVHDYPSSMKMSFPYMPEFTVDDKKLLAANRPDFYGLNHYGTGFFSATDGLIETNMAMGKSSWLFMSGWGFRKLLNWVSKRYGYDMPIYCTEGGWSVEAKSAQEGKYNPGGVMYYYQYLMEAHNAIFQDGVPLKGYYAWSVMDNYEWELGYSERFGITWNDFEFGEPFADPNSPNMETPVYDHNTGKISGPCGNKCIYGNGNMAQNPDPKSAYNQTRHPKNSALYLQWIWQSNTLVDPATFLAGSIGGDICYGEGEYRDDGNSASGAVQCGFDHAKDSPGPVPLEEYGCADDRTPCGGKGIWGVACCNPEHVCMKANEAVSMCSAQSMLV